MQTELFETAKEPKVDKNKYIKLALDAANRKWKSEAEATIELLIKRGTEFTAANVITILDQRGLKTKDNRALGGIIQGYNLRGEIHFVRYIKSPRSLRHGGTQAVWRAA